MHISELKWLFMKIHYFGRKINWKRRAAARKDIEVEVSELLKIIEEIRKKYPDKEKITSSDILQVVIKTWMRFNISRMIIEVELCCGLIR